MKQKSLYKKVALFLGSILIALLIVEVLLRTINYYPIYLDIDLFVHNNNELLPYKLKPNYDGYYLGKKVLIDHDGYRVVSPKIVNSNSIQDSELRKTILILGDSLVFGHGLDNDETVASQLQSLINEKGLDYKLLNIGVPGYMTWNEYEAFKEYLEYSSEKIDLVILVYVFNDITEDNNQLNLMKTDQKRKFGPVGRFLHSNIYSLSLLKHLYIAILYKRKSNLNKTQYERKVSELKAEYMDERSLKYSMQAISELKKLCDQYLIDLVVVLPRYHQWDHKYPEFSREFEALVMDKLEETGVKSLLATYAVDKLTIDEIDVYINDSHPSSLATRFFVEELYNQILNEKREHGQD